MAHKIIQVLEREEIGIEIASLIEGDRIAIDPRIAKKNYISIALSGGQIRMSSTRFVGLIPFNEHYSIRIIPRISLSNLTAIIIRGGTLPTVVEGYTRGYAPLFSQSDRALEICAKTLVVSARKLARVGLIKDYISVKNPPQWRGKLLISDTAKKYRAKGIKYKADFDYRTLSKDIPHNQIIKAALVKVREWNIASKNRLEGLNHIGPILEQFHGVDGEAPFLGRIVMSTPEYARRIPAHRLDYEKAMWASYSILQHAIPELTKENTVKLDSLIVDMAAAFEAFVREVLREHLNDFGLEVRDGNRADVAAWFFSGGASGYSVHPDLVIERDGQPIAIFDVKYKPGPKDQDRYELLAFMESYGVAIGGFVCPCLSGNDFHGLLGETIIGKQMHLFRFDMSAQDLTREEQNLIGQVRGVLSF